MNTIDVFDPNGVGVDNGAYFGLPFTTDEARLILISVPWDVTVSYGSGTADAPDAIIELYPLLPIGTDVFISQD